MSCHQPTWTPLSQSINGMHSAIVICGKSTSQAKAWSRKAAASQHDQGILRGEGSNPQAPEGKNSKKHHWATNVGFSYTLGFIVIIYIYIYIIKFIVLFMDIYYINIFIYLYVPVYLYIIYIHVYISIYIYAYCKFTNLNLTWIDLNWKN